MKKSELVHVVEAPVISEKSTAAAELQRRVVFRVSRKATKEQIRRAVEYLFNVQVDSVHVLNVKGKTKRVGRTLGTRSDWKKAYVKLKEGFDIDFAIS